jgi:Trk K+ transport system NAD-binding subunit
MAAREAGYEGQVVALAENPLHRHAMTKAGADIVFTPRHVLAAALAARASQRISPSVSGVQQMGPNVSVAQLRVTADSHLAGRTLDESGIRETMGATVIGLWHDGKLNDQPNGDTCLYPRSILIAMGSQQGLARLSELAAVTPFWGKLVVAGYGEVGAKVTELLRDAGEEVMVVSDSAGEGVDITGNLLQQQTLDAAGIRDARAVILTIGNDSESLFAAAILRDYAPDVPLYARVNVDQSVERLHRLGTDFALSLGQVSGRLLAYHLVGEDYLSVEPALRVVKATPGRLAGSRPGHAGVLESTGCQIVAVGRGTEVFVEFPPDFIIGDDDLLYVCGSEQALETYFEVFPAAHEAA